MESLKVETVFSGDTTYPHNRDTYKLGHLCPDQEKLTKSKLNTYLESAKRAAPEMMDSRLSSNIRRFLASS